ncbi:MAG: hypothetical protein ABEL04_02790 [Salinibacter sp.]|uniref:hypothetical protein n=1 Tax=Salinibacter sp. TaxID=2065818 RepID=UPI0035D45B25
MPIPVLALLVLAVGLYVLLFGIVSVQYMVARRRTSPSDVSDTPPTSIVLDARSGHVHDALEPLTEADILTDQRDVVLVCTASTETSSLPGSPEQIRRVEVDEPTSSGPWSALQVGLKAAQGDVALVLSSSCSGSADWARAMVQRCTPDTPIVVGPTVVEHNDRFLPRLEALHRFMEIAMAAGLGGHELLSHRQPNLAVRTSKVKGFSAADEASQENMLSADNAPAIATEPEAAVSCGPAASVQAYVCRQARLLRRVVRHFGWWPRWAAVGIWFVHVAVLIACLVAVVVPAWRQPALAVLLAKMGGDALLAVPAARHYGQHSLLRSFVPGELFLVFAVPFAGLLAFYDLLSPAPPTRS